jgi:hypothetical protein
MSDFLKRHGANAAAIVAMLSICTYVGISAPWYARADGLKLAGDVESIAAVLLQNQYDDCLRDLWRAQDQSRAEPQSQAARDALRRQQELCASWKERLSKQVRTR